VTTFNSDSARAAAQKSAEVRRAKREAPLDAEAILEDLARTAKSENVRSQSAKALVALRQQGKITVEEDAIERAKSELLSRLLPEEIDVLRAALEREERPPQSPAERLA
jgi:hypothetical protein